MTQHMVPVMEVTGCRVCGGRLNTFWKAHNICVVDFPQYPNESTRPRCDLDLCRCENCHLVQLRHSVHPDILYRMFWYLSGTNVMMREALSDIVNEACARVTLRDGDAVLDIGANDGFLISRYGLKGAGRLRTVGCEPAKNITRVIPNGDNDVHWINDYFSARACQQTFGPDVSFKIITAIAMFYDLEDPAEFLRDVVKVLDYEGIFVIQMNYLKSMMENNAVDNVCHEHLTYYTLTTLKYLLDRVGLKIIHASENPINGGSFRVIAAHPESAHQISPTVSAMLEAETEFFGSCDRYLEFSNNVRDIMSGLSEQIVAYNKAGLRVYAYGASTRGSTTIQLLSDEAFIMGAAERDARKFGRYMVGSKGIPIVSEEEARASADVFLMLPWHFCRSIVEREREWLSQEGRKFLVPFPKPFELTAQSKEESK